MTASPQKRSKFLGSKNLHAELGKQVRKQRENRVFQARKVQSMRIEKGAPSSQSAKREKGKGEEERKVFYTGQGEGGKRRQGRRRGEREKRERGKEGGEDGKPFAEKERERGRKVE